MFYDFLSELQTDVHLGLKLRQVEVAQVQVPILGVPLCICPALVKGDGFFLIDEDRKCILMKDLPENEPMVNMHGDNHKIQGSKQGKEF